MAVYNYRIGAGHGLPIGSLTNIEDIVPSGDTAFYPPDVYGSYNPGQFIIRGDGSVYLSGYPSEDWHWHGNPGGRISRLQVRYLQETYCNNGYSGPVTILTQTDNPGVYGRYNAIMVLPKLPEGGKNFTVFQDYRVQMTRLGSLTYYGGTI